MIISMKEDCKKRLYDLIFPKKPMETGGILVGVRTKKEFSIQEIVDAGPKSIETRSRFKKDFQYAQSELSRLYRESQGKWGYLGEWHSHPDGSLIPSCIDKLAMKEIAISTENYQFKPILLIGDIIKNKLEYQVYISDSQHGILTLPIYVCGRLNVP